MNNAAFGKTMENVRKHRDIKLVATERRRNYLVTEPNYYTKKYFIEHLLAIETEKKKKKQKKKKKKEKKKKKKTEIRTNKPVYLGF